MRFQPSRNWMNDPNGPIFYQGKWHLFYQFNPEGDQWGEIGWGHASSTDLITWREHDLAISADDEHYIFSGSVVHDTKNVSEFGPENLGPLIAFYTGHSRKAPQQQVQCLAYSNDHGETWEKYSGNPIIDLGEADFRDPKVFWHAASQRWVMLTVLAKERAVLFFTSQDLKSWVKASRFNAPKTGEHEWECPDLLALPVECSDHISTKWVLFVSVGGGAPAGGVGVKYFVGEFDGETFVPDVVEDNWVDHGPDFYAPQSFAGIDTLDSGGVWLGWMNNWIYAKHTFANPARGMMTTPRRIRLTKDASGFKLIQTPFSGAVVTNLSSQETSSMRFSSELGESATLDLDLKGGKLVFDRAGLSEKLPNSFRMRHSIDWDPLPGLGANVVKSEKGVEIFLNGGRTVFTALLQFEGERISVCSDKDRG